MTLAAPVHHSIEAEMMSGDSMAPSSLSIPTGPGTGGPLSEMFTRGGTLILPIGILVIISMMIVPLPTALLDVFFVGNILLSLLILMVAIHAQRPLDFSSFPTLLLIATTLRLALNVASTRIVLTDGHNGHDAAGQVIAAFSNFVVGGNFVVGLLVFAILVVINMMVIAKGAGRISEVSARFTLDALPGKQMAIDADLNAGLLTPEAARARREEVAEEADFYGSMDGASKFVKGDAVAGIIILAINVVGGIIIGTVQHDLPFAEAADTYVRLSVGDGLVAQVPALLLSIAAAIIVTRSSSASDMGSQMGRQVNMAGAWAPTAAVLTILSLVPGMPNLVFLTAGALAAGAAFFAARKGGTRQPSAGRQSNVSAPNAVRSLPVRGEVNNKETAGSTADTAPITPEEVTDVAPLSLQIGYKLISLASSPDGGTLVSRITAIRRELSKSLGIVVPGMRIRDDLGLPPNCYRIRIGQTIVAEGEVHPDRKLAIPGPGSVRRLAGITVREPSFGLEAVWIQTHQVAEAEADDQTVVDPEAVIATNLGQILQRHADDLVGPDDVQALLDALSQTAPTLVETVVPKLVPLHVLVAVMRNLLAERVPVADLRRILDGLAQMSGQQMSIPAQAEALRPALVPLMLQQMVPIGSPVPLMTLAPELEQLLIRARRPQDEGLVLDPGLANALLSEINAARETETARSGFTVLCTSPILRRHVATFLKPFIADMPVLSLAEIPASRQVEVRHSIGLPARTGASLPASQTQSASRE